MLKLFKYLKPYIWLIIPLVILTYLQVMANLSLPDLMAKIVEENSNITDYKEMCQRDCFYDTKQALELGLIDKLL